MHFQQVCSFFVEAYENLKEALEEDDEVKLKAYFGPGFNYEAEKSFSSAASFAAAPLAAQPRAYGITDEQAE